ncbi:MAG: T9SS type A sorting domain-containing protein [Candidatus Moranbacteria bacterium]|nr:T9SS type A sorting domain-containing protein [Candidatus Moranbacteria bacterium]
MAKVELHYRKKGQLSFNKSTMNHQGNNIYKTEISKRFSSSDDIEYYIKAIDDFGVSSYAALPDVPYVIEMQNAAGLNLNEFGNGVKIYPNPVTNGSFVINFDNADKAQKYRLTLINTAGMKLTELYNDYLPAGNSVVPVQLKGINNGVYFVEIRTESDVYFRKLVVE